MIKIKNRYTGKTIKEVNADTLQDANLSGADLGLCSGNNKEVLTVQTGIYHVALIKGWMFAGCESRSIDEWKALADDDLKHIDGAAVEFARLWRDVLFDLHDRHFGGGS